MLAESDRALESLFGSRTRLLTMAVLANTEKGLTGYRIAKLAHLPREKVYPELRKGKEAGFVTEDGAGFRLSDPDVRALLKKRIRISWSEDWFAGERNRAKRAQTIASLPMTWFDSSRYVPNASVAARYSKEIERPSLKDILPQGAGRGVSRKRK